MVGAYHTVIYYYTMHRLFAILASASTTTTTSSCLVLPKSSFWHDETRIRNELGPLGLVPPPALLPRLQTAPFRGGLEPAVDIAEHECQVLEGKIPEDITGILCRNGPGRIRLPSSSSHQQYGHWFDGDGFVTKLTLRGDGKATYTAKYVHTERYQAQEQQQQSSKNSGGGFAKAGAWTARATGKWWQNLVQFPTNPANTNIIFTRQETSKQEKPRLYAIAEGGDPVPLDLHTLCTTGPAQPWTSADGSQTASSFFSAHASRDFRTHEIYNHGVRLGPPQAVLNLMKFTAGGKLLLQRSHTLPFLTFLHDNVISERYMVLVLQPFGAPSGALLDLLLGKQPLGQQLEWNTDKFGQDSIVLVYAKDTLECVAQVPIGPVSSYHLLDSFEGETDNNSTLTLRLLVHNPPDIRNHVEDCFKDLYSAKQVPACDMREIVMDLSTQTVVQNRQILPDALPCELPDTNVDWPSFRKQYAYLNVRGVNDAFLNQVQKVNLETGQVGRAVSFGPHTFAGAPLFVSKPNPLTEDDGYVFSQVYRADDHRTDVVILDARTMQLVTRMRLSSHVPYQFHGAWCSFDDGA